MLHARQVLRAYTCKGTVQSSDKCTTSSTHKTRSALNQKKTWRRPPRDDGSNGAVNLPEETSISEARMKAAVNKAEKNLLKSHWRHQKPHAYTTPRHRWFFTGSRVIQRNLLRKEAMVKLAERNVMDRAMYHMILNHLAQLEQSLQAIVDEVRPPRGTKPHRIKYTGYRKFVEKLKEHPAGRLWKERRRRYRVAWKWLALRERAWQLRSERDIQWNRVHASQLALIERRLEDQEIQLTRLEGQFAGFLCLRTHEA